VTIHDAKTIKISTTALPILQGCKNAGLWTVTLDQKEKHEPQNETVNNVYSIPSMKEAIRYLHAAAGFPVKDTWLEAIRAGNFITWLGVSIKTVSPHFPESEETQKGHMKKTTQKCQINKSKRGPTSEVDDSPKPTQKKEHEVYNLYFNASKTMHTDQTGCFPATSISGNKYIMIMAKIDKNYIDAEPMKDKSKGSMIKAYNTLWEMDNTIKVSMP
jgi:hypothetical protein